MNIRTLVAVPAVAMVLVLTQFVCEADAQNKDIRVKCLAFDQNVGFTLDVAQGQQKTQANVQPGSRGYIIWEDFNNQVIMTGSIKLDTMNVIITISGDATNGYTVATAVTADDI
jgi:hypothetical protein